LKGIERALRICLLILFAVAILLPDFEMPTYTPGIFTIPFVTLVSFVDENPGMPDTYDEFIDLAQFLGFLWAGPIAIVLEILLIQSRSTASRWVLQAVLIAISVLLLLAMLTNQYFSIFDYTFSQLVFYTLVAGVLAEILIIFMERSYRTRHL
jgi:hypothetical protein